MGVGEVGVEGAEFADAGVGTEDGGWAGAVCEVEDEDGGERGVGNVGFDLTLHPPSLAPRLLTLSVFFLL